MAKKKFRFEITLRGAVVFACDGTGRPRRGLNPRVLLVDKGDCGNEPKGPGKCHCEDERNRPKGMPYHYPYLTVAREDMRNPCEYDRCYVGTDGRYYVMMPLYNRKLDISTLDNVDDREVRMPWLPGGPIDPDVSRSPTDDLGRKIRSFTAMDWSLRSEELGIVVNEDAAVATVRLPSGKLSSSSLLRYTTYESNYRCMEWVIWKDNEKVATQAVADTLILTATVREPLKVLAVSTDSTNDELFSLDPRPGNKLRIAISNVPAFVCNPDMTHLNVYNAINSGPNVKLDMERVSGGFHPGGACPHLICIK